MNENITAVVITYNEEKNIRECLESIKWADEIIVVDSNSSDKTREICKQFTDKVYTHEWMGYSRQKNFGIDKAKNNWILSVDADERISPELKEEITATAGSPKFDAYFFPRKSYFLGQWINYSGWYPDCQLRLFKKTSAKFNENRSVHEGVFYTGQSGIFKHDLLHYPYGSLAHYFVKFNEYTTLSSSEIYKKKKIRFIWLHLIFDPLFVFIKSFIFKKGFLDKKAGFAICSISSFNTLVKYAKLWELYENSRQKNHSKKP